MGEQQRISDPIEEFKEEVEGIIRSQGEDETFKELSRQWMVKSLDTKYSYTFRWLGRPIIQYPQDIMAMQEIIWEVKPDLIVEAGIAHGGSLIFYASMMKLLDIALGREKRGHVLGIDIDIREHNRKEIEAHPMYDAITMYQGSSIDAAIVDRVHDFSKDYERIIVVLDSNHTADHVLEECRKYSDLVSLGSYLVAMDTISETLYKAKAESGEELLEHMIRPWGLGNNVANGVEAFLKENSSFEADHDKDNKLMLTCAPHGYLKRVR